MIKNDLRNSEIYKLKLVIALLVAFNIILIFILLNLNLLIKHQKSKHKNNPWIIFKLKIIRGLF